MIESMLAKRLIEYGDSDYYPYHMPGHKRRLYGKMPEDCLKMDITEIDGFDNLHQAEGILKEAQERAADLYGADATYFMINGSTGGILSAISACLPYGGHLLMARNCHKSAYHAIYLRNLEVTYLYPGQLQEYDICEAITPEQVAEALKREPDIGAVLLVSPTYEGRIADIAAIAEVVHKRGIPLIVDEAHGAHLGFGDGWAQNSVRAGADLVIHSVHKTLPAMTQTALLHLKGNIVSRRRLERFLHIYQSSSPSYVLMSSIDNALTIVEQEGRELFLAFQSQFKRMLSALSVCRRLLVLPLEEKRQDIGKLVVSVKKTGLSGQQLYDILLEKYHLQLEMATASYVLAMFTIADREEAYERMTQALLEIDKMLAEEEPDVQKQQECAAKKTLCRAMQELALAQAWDQPAEGCILEESCGRAAGDFINLYPPGIPLVVPGERMTKELIRQISDCLLKGLSVQGVWEEEGRHRIQVLKI